MTTPFLLVALLFLLVVAVTATLGWVRARRRQADAQSQLLAIRQQLDSQRAAFDKIERIAKMGSWTSYFKDGSLEASDAYLAIYGVTLDEMPRTLHEYASRFIDDDQYKVEANENIVRLDHGQTVEGVRRIRLDSGARKWLYFRSEPFFEADGSPLGLRGIVRDVTQEREREDRLTETTELLSEVHRIARICHFYWDLATDEVKVSDDYFETFGIAPQDRYSHMHQWVERHCHPDDRPQVNTVSSATILAGQPYVVIRRSRGSDGVYRYFEIHGEPVRNQAGQLVAYRGTARDVSDHQRNLIRTAESEERFRRLTELSSDWYWEQDAEHRFTFISRAKTLVSQTPRSEVLGKTRWELFPQAMTDDEWAQHRAVLDARKPYYELVTRIIRPDTPEVVAYFSISGEPVFERGDRFMGYRGIGKDITRRKMAERALTAKTAELSRANELLKQEAAKRQQLERSMLMVIEAAMTRVGSELHDELGQDLAGIALLSKSLERRLAMSASPNTQEAARISTLVNQTIRHARMISHGLSPHIMGSNGLVCALHQLAADINALNAATCETAVREVEISDEVASRALYRIAQEATAFVLRHTSASRIRISLKSAHGGVQLVVANNGRVQIHAQEVGADTGRNLDSIRHRARAINAQVDVKMRSTKGTAIRVLWRTAEEVPKSTFAYDIQGTTQ